MSFWSELKRRNVFKVGAAYLIAGWLILQVASITFPALSFPRWALPLVTVFLIIGFIMALILAWAYEMSPEKDQEYFVDGLSEEILNCLAKIPDMLVTARTSSFAFKGKDKTVQEIADVLGVENVLEGSV